MAEPHDLSDDVTGIGLPELGDLRLTALLSSSHSAIAQAVRRVRSDTERHTENYAAFGNTP